MVVLLEYGRLPSHGLTAETVRPWHPELNKAITLQ